MDGKWTKDMAGALKDAGTSLSNESEGIKVVLIVYIGAWCACPRRFSVVRAHPLLATPPPSPPSPTPVPRYDPQNPHPSRFGRTMNKIPPPMAPLRAKSSSRATGSSPPPPAPANRGGLGSTTTLQAAAAGWTPRGADPGTTTATTTAEAATAGTAGVTSTSVTSTPTSPGANWTSEFMYPDDASPSLQDDDFLNEGEWTVGEGTGGAEGEGYDPEWLERFYEGVATLQAKYTSYSTEAMGQLLGAFGGDVDKAEELIVALEREARRVGTGEVKGWRPSRG